MTCSFKIGGRSLWAFWGAQKVVAKNHQFLLAAAPNTSLTQFYGGYRRKVIPPSKGHGSKDQKEKETNIGYETQGKSVLNYLCLSLNVPLLFSTVRKSKKKVIKFPSHPLPPHPRPRWTPLWKSCPWRWSPRSLQGTAQSPGLVGAEV